MTKIKHLNNEFFPFGGARGGFQKISKITLVLVYLVIIAGAVVRMTGSGMGCPDWPKCFGHLIPPTEESQIQWHPNEEYKKGQVIIVNESLRLAKEKFTSTNSYSENNWEPYTKHDYAVFNASHTWVEYINRLFGALAGLATLVMAVMSFSFWKKKKSITILSWLVVFGMGFQAWLGKTVVDSNLQPFKITIHMVMALVIVAFILYIIYATREKNDEFKKDNIFRILIIFSLILTLIQVVLGTQVRQFIDDQMRSLGEEAKDLWLLKPTIQFYTHRTFSILVFILNVFLFMRNKKLNLGYTKMNWVMLLILLEVVSGMIMYYADFPFGSQTIHLIIAAILFGIQFYLVLENRKSISSIKSL